MKRALILAALPTLMAATAFAQNSAGERGFVWNDRPTIVFGDDINIEVKGRALLEWRWFDPDIGEDTFHLRTARVGLKGKLTRHFDWEIEREITEDDDGKVIFGEWKDVYLDWNTFDRFSARGGRFILPIPRPSIV